ncbi:MAG TPA: hypothetical protein GX743_10865 [Actinomycetales bacterium]|nr:hypothetical protein [Actinomycetales bacterium]
MGLWADRSEIRGKHLTVAKTAVVAVIVLTTLLPLAFVAPDEASARVNVYKYLAKTGAFVGAMLMIWQFLLGFRGLASELVPDLSWVTKVHAVLGQYGVPTVLLHPVFIGLYYAETRGQNIFALDLSEPFSVLVLLGMVMLAVVAFVIVTSAFLRERLGFYPWLYTHLSTYLVPPFLFVHSFLLGPTVQGTGLRYYWWFFTALVAALYVYRVAHKLGLTAARYTVAGTRTVADGTTEVTLDPQGRGLRPAPGQFVYLRRSLAENAHPYTVSGFEEESGALSVTVKEDGPQSAGLQEAQEEDPIILDGPFGVFTRPAMATDLPTIMVAGGVGITPFRRLWQRLEQERDREAHLFYGNEKRSEIIYEDELDSLEHVHVVHVLNDEPGFEGEQGIVDADLLRRHLPTELADYQFLLCGPPAMIHNLRSELAGAGVPPEQIREELFAT